jgi:hypothetical protein
MGRLIYDAAKPVIRRVDALVAAERAGHGACNTSRNPPPHPSHNPGNTTPCHNQHHTAYPRPALPSPSHLSLSPSSVKRIRSSKPSGRGTVRASGGTGESRVCGWDGCWGTVRIPEPSIPSSSHMSLSQWFGGWMWMLSSLSSGRGTVRTTYPDNPTHIQTHTHTTPHSHLSSSPSKPSGPFLIWFLTPFPPAAPFPIPPAPSLCYRPPQLCPRNSSLCHFLGNFLDLAVNFDRILPASGALTQIFGRYRRGGLGAPHRGAPCPLPHLASDPRPFSSF